MSKQIKISLPKKLKALDVPMRYKMLYGGRGSGKSWGVATKLLLLGVERPLRILCTREVQKSIAQSVHRLLSDQIARLGLGGFYTVLQTEIRGKNGTLFIFNGLSDQTADSIKSFEGVDYCWIEEGQAITEKSLRILSPTIRKENSEIWVTYNPQLETDPIHQLAMSGRADVLAVEMNYTDNPFFPEVLEKERQEAERTLPKAEYEHIWKGKCMPAVQGAIYFDEVANAQEQGRIARVHYDPQLKVHTVWDLGFNDSMFIIFVQRLASEIRIIKAIEDSKRTIDSYVVDDILPLKYNWGDDYLPHDGFAVRHQTAKSDADILRGKGRRVLQTPNIDVESGIRRVRDVFPRIYFNNDDDGVKRLIECLKRYRRHINKATNEPNRPVHDEYSHGADAFRYLCLVADKLTNDTHRPSSTPPSKGGGSWQG